MGLYYLYGRVFSIFDSVGVLDNDRFSSLLFVYMAIDLSKTLGLGTTGTWNYGGLILPDFQLTEAAAARGAIPSNSTTVNQSVINPTGANSGGATFPTANTSGQTLGVQSTQAPQPTSGGSSTPSGQSSAGDSRLTELQKISQAGGLNPAQQSELQALQAQLKPQGPSEAEINAVYEPTMNYLNQAESQIRGDYPTVLEAAQKAYESAISELTASKTKNLGTIAENQASAGSRKENALAEARRLYDELRRGYQQRFGGSTSAGQAASELSAVEQQRQMGAVNRDYSTTVRQIEQSKLQLDQDYQAGQAKIEEQKTLALQQAQQNFTQALLQIQSQRAQTESQKAAAKLQALTDLRNQAFQIQQDALNYQKNLDMFYRQQQADLQTYAAKLQLSGQGAQTAGNTYNPVINPTSLTIGGSTQQAGPLTGYKKDELTGQTVGTVRQYDPVTGQYIYPTATQARSAGL